MKYIISKIILKLGEFMREEDRKKKEVLGKEISNLCSANFKTLAQKEIKVAEVIYPLIALGYFKAEDNNFDPESRTITKIMVFLKKYLE